MFFWHKRYGIKLQIKEKNMEMLRSMEKKKCKILILSKYPSSCKTL